MDLNLNINVNVNIPENAKSFILGLLSMFQEASAEPKRETTIIEETKVIAEPKKEPTIIEETKVEETEIVEETEEYLEKVIDVSKASELQMLVAELVKSEKKEFAKQCLSRNKIEKVSSIKNKDYDTIKKELEEGLTKIPLEENKSKDVMEN